MQDMLQLLDLLKQQSGRMQFQEAMRLVGGHHMELLPPAFQTVRDLFMAGLRQANNQSDYLACKIFLDLSLQLYMTHSDHEVTATSHTFLYTEIKQHEVFMNPTFWEMVFLDVYSAERHRISATVLLEQRQEQLARIQQQGSSGGGGGGGQAGGASPFLWTQLTPKQRAALHTGELNMVKNLLKIFANSMLKCSVSKKRIFGFIKNMSGMHGVSGSLQAKMFKFINHVHATLSNPVFDASKESSDAVENEQEIAKYTGKRIDDGSVLDTMRLKQGALKQIRSGGVSLRRQRSDTHLGGREQRGKWVKFTSKGGLVFFHDITTNKVQRETPASWGPGTSSVKHSELGASARRDDEDEKASIQTMVKPPPRLLGEFQVKSIAGVMLMPSKHIGSLFLSNYRVTFVSRDPSFQENPLTKALRQVATHSLHRTEYRANEHTVLLHTKDCRVVTIRFLAESQAMATNFLDLLEQYAWPGHQQRCFAYIYKEPISRPEHDGWNVYDVEAEFRRQGALMSGKWVLSDVNHDFVYSPTYPARLVLPAAMSRDEIISLGKFRSKARIPVLSYQHWRGGAVILRASQPKVGITQKRSAADERFMELCNVRYIIDARPKVNAMANKAAKGAGYENVGHYTKMQLSFMDIENIHVMRDSLGKLVDACQQASAVADTGSAVFNKMVDDSNWLNHVRLVLQAAANAAVLVHFKNASCLVHCSDGWDRTAQITALAQLMLDPFFRTIRGFAVLIQKEWLSFGHKFGQRIGHCDPRFDDSQRSPVFMQFLDCVWQVMQQFPVSFEFNDELLAYIADHLSSCKYGTFLYDNERERVEGRVRFTTVSMWTRVLKNVERFTNQMYEQNDHVIVPRSDLRVLRVWPYYYRYDLTMTQQESLREQAGKRLELSDVIHRTQMTWMEQKLAEMEDESTKRVQQTLRAQLAHTRQRNDQLMALLRQNGIAVPPPADTVDFQRFKMSSSTSSSSSSSSSSAAAPPPLPQSAPPPPAPPSSSSSSSAKARSSRAATRPKLPRPLQGVSEQMEEEVVEERPAAKSAGLVRPMGPGGRQRTFTTDDQ
eukprot:TRINITY_DN63874_c0_g1_i1.p1 TRINITY_DN63874_c0_g1~~TRINITY_DN63874_c0_g1_i1.p1  ORF type:complete len:1121 (+),score=591.58 TRINITY_DN63874_c0_g1_i1:188-3364(+)